MIAAAPRQRAFLMLIAALALSAAACLFTAQPVRAAARARVVAPPRTPYPTGATRAQLYPRATEYAHAASTSGGSSAPAKKKKKKIAPVLSANATRALATFEAMQRQYYITGSGLYDGEPFSYLWPFSQALAATVSLANIPHLSVGLNKHIREQVNERLNGLKEYLDANNSGAPEGVYTSTLPAFDGTVAPPAGPGGAKYYDDNDWVGIEMLRLYQLTHSQAFLGSAEGIMTFEMAAWDERPEVGCPGGIPFSNAAESSERNTVTTAPAAELATLLYRYTKDVGYLQFAQKAYAWVRGCLLEASGLYGDHVNRRGVVMAALWSYNQGTMIGAGALLYHATADPAYLWQARQTAKAALAYFTPERLGAENPFFVSVYLRNLLYLDSLTHDPPGAAIAQAYVNYAWEHWRLSDDVFVFGSPASAQLLDQAAIAQIYGLLATPPSSYF